MTTNSEILAQLQDAISSPEEKLARKREQQAKAEQLQSGFSARIEVARLLNKRPEDIPTDYAVKFMEGFNALGTE